jgi:hypothetical protein
MHARVCMCARWRTHKGLRSTAGQDARELNIRRPRFIRLEETNDTTWQAPPPGPPPSSSLLPMAQPSDLKGMVRLSGY